MKFKTGVFFIILVFIMCIANLAFAETGRLVDIPVPPNSAGYADCTEEEAAERANEYEESKNNVTTAENLVGKSSNYYLKSLNIEGYNLNPEFNRQRDTYTIYVKDNSVDTFKVSAEADNENAKVDGIGKVTISEEQRAINVTVIAENGNEKVYTINVENEENRNKDSNANTTIKLIIIIAVILIIICIVAVIIKKRHKNN